MSPVLGWPWPCWGEDTGEQPRSQPPRCAKMAAARLGQDGRWPRAVHSPYDVAEDWVRDDHRLFSSTGKLQGGLFYGIRFLLPVVQSHPSLHCLFALAFIASPSKAPWVGFAVPGSSAHAEALCHGCFGAWLAVRWEVSWSLGSASRTAHPGCWWWLCPEAMGFGCRGCFGCGGG